MSWSDLVALVGAAAWIPQIARHGHGTGALRKAISKFLSDHPHVARLVAASENQGGSGVTLGELKV